MNELSEIERARIVIEYGFDAPELLVFDLDSRLLARVPLKRFVDDMYYGQATILCSGVASYAAVQLEDGMQIMATIGTDRRAGDIMFVSTALVVGDSIIISRLKIR